MLSTKYLFTDGVGFIGINIVKNLVRSPKNNILIVDNLTYSVNILNDKSSLQKKTLN